MMINNILLTIFIFCIFSIPKISIGIEIDIDKDGLSNQEEIHTYFTDPNNPDSDNDGYNDGKEVRDSYDPNKNESTKIQKIIYVDIKNQVLAYKLGPYVIDSFKVSTGVKKTTPTGEYKVLIKKPLVTYKGRDYFYPNTKWNLQFKYMKSGSLYIHGAYWHKKFGTPVTHGCINVEYENMEKLYNWSETGTKIVISG
jgi:lipoprotein-anchoring transpeptidase ErfK/SrfK